MTRTRDTLIALGDRGAFCTEECDLFVSLHVNSLPRRRGYTEVRGYETFFLAEAKTEDAERVAKMENEAVRFEPETEATAEQQGLNFILKDLAANEYLRESARLLALAVAAAPFAAQLAGLLVAFGRQRELDPAALGRQRRVVPARPHRVLVEDDAVDDDAVAADRAARGGPRGTGAHD
jgi:N-acetylmuramoyl-L-alanine amidase